MDCLEHLFKVLTFLCLSVTDINGAPQNCWSNDENILNKLLEEVVFFQLKLHLFKEKVKIPVDNDLASDNLKYLYFCLR